MINVGLIGIGGMGRMHFNCYGANPNAKVVAICDVDPRKLNGDWSSIGLNIDTSETALVDLSGVRGYADWRDIITQSDVNIVDICLPTPLHAEVTIAALKAGKNVLCEKPMAFTVQECEAVEAALKSSTGKFLVGHCLRYWPEYVKADEVIRSGDYGKVLRASFHRSGAAPLWSWDNWLLDGARSGGAVLDMHIHDVDTALWWFGEPDSIRAVGFTQQGLPLSVDAQWLYKNGPSVTLHGSWDTNGGPFRYAFNVVMERATISHDSAVGPALNLYANGETTALEVPPALAYQLEIDDMVDAVATGRAISRVTSEASRLAVRAALEEILQISADAT